MPCRLFLRGIIDSFGTRRLHYCIPNLVRRIAVLHFVNVLTFATSTLLAPSHFTTKSLPTRDIASAKWRGVEANILIFNIFF